tara:strand:+ start:59214 stop:60125 length:912 start_codon:yes stop_codon:yes gene_type:complete
MKKTLLGTILLSTFFSANVIAQETNWYERFADKTKDSQQEMSFSESSDKYFESSYFSLGVERFELTMEDSGNRYKGASMFNATYGLDMTRYVSFELSASLPISSKVYETYEDRYYDFDNGGNVGDTEVTYPEISIDNYKNQIDPSYIVSANVKLDIPVTERVSGYLMVGYSKSKISYQGIGTLFLNELTTEQLDTYNAGELDYSSLNSNQFMIGFNDTLPLEQMTDREQYNQYTSCELTGNETLCGKAIVDINQDYEQNGAMYGAGVSFDYNNNTSLILDYKKYAYNKRLDIEAIRFGIQWRF